MHPSRHARPTRRTAAVLLAAALLMTTAACSSGGSGGSAAPSRTPAGGPTLPDLHGATVQVAAIWTGAEQRTFQAVLDDFTRRTGARTVFVPTGDNVAAFLGTRLQGGSPPDVALLPQVGVLHQFARAGRLVPLGEAATAAVDRNYSRTWRELGAWKGTAYGVYVKAANKSTVWYNTRVLADAGVEPPATWDAFLAAARTVADSGTPAVAVGGADGWTLTDWFENVYLSQAGPAAYDRLARHAIPWTDPSVGAALRELARLFREDALLAGGRRGALRTEFPASVAQTFADPPRAGMVFEGDFVAAVIADETGAKVGEDAAFFPFPKVGAGERPVVTAGDVAVALTRTPAAQALLTYLASPEAAAVAAERGGFLSPNRRLDPAAYPDATTRGIAEALIRAGDAVRFDLSDQAPAAFGGTKGGGAWKALQDFLARPDDVAGAQRALEAEAAKAYGG